MAVPRPASGELVSVVVPALNEEQFIGRCLDSLRAQSHADLQIIVVDGNSTDATAEIVAKHRADDGRVELLHNPRRSIPVSMNLGLARAVGRWLVRVDAHSVVPRSYVSVALERLQEERWGGVGGRKDGVGVTPAGRAIAVAMGSRFGVGNSTYHHGTRPSEVDHIPFGAYPVELLRRFGGWDERLVANEDYELDYRLRRGGARLLFDPNMCIEWYCRQSIPDLFRQYLRYGRGKLDVALLHPESLSPRHLAPPTLIAYLAGAALTARRSPGFAAGLFGVYLAAVGAASAQVGRRLDSRRERLLTAPAFAAMHCGWGLGFWSGALSAAGRRAHPAANKRPGSPPSGRAS